jgi:tetratricopeptide (TPR) repeat protein
VSSETPAPDTLAEKTVRGAAAIESGHAEEAVKEFTECAQLAPDSAAVWVNLALAYIDTGEHRKALEALAQAEKLDPDMPYVAFNSALCHKRLQETHLAVALFRRVIAVDPNCAEAHYNLGLLLRDLNQWELAENHLEQAAKLNPDHVYTRYHLMRLALLRRDNPKALEEFRHFSRLRSRATYPALDIRASERSVYSVPLEPSSRGGWDLIELSPSFCFQEVDFPNGVLEKPETGLPLVVAWFELDGDGKPDIALGAGNKVKALRNEGAFQFAPMPPVPDAAPGGAIAEWVVGDFDNDRRLDLLAACQTGERLYLTRPDQPPKALPLADLGENEGDVTDVAGMDCDHDGDLDLVILRGREKTRPALVRNNGDGTYKRISGALEPKGCPAAIAFGDLDGDYDTDILFADAEGPPQWYRNLGAGRFKPEGTPEGLQSALPTREAVLEDFNNDLYLDLLLLSRKGEPVLFLNKRNESFEQATALRALDGLSAKSMAVADLDNDGFLDLLLCVDTGQAKEAGPPGLELLRGGPSGFHLVPDAALPNGGAGFDARQLLPEDVDADGDLDLLVVEHSGRLRLLRNEGGNANHWLRVRAAGMRSNASGVGTRIDIRDGWRRQRRQSHGMPVHVGLGKRSSVQVLRLLWTTGLVQNYTSPQSDQTLEVQEDARIPTSCPFLFGRTSQGFRFITDFLGGGALGEYGPPGQTNTPDPDDVLVIEPEQIEAKDGQYTLRITFELQEVIYLDAISLSAIDHVPGLKAVAETALHQPPRTGVALHALQNLRPVKHAWDTAEHDVTELLSRTDTRAVSDFRLERQPGLTHPHSLTLDMGDGVQPARTVLLLHGWTEWPTSSSVLSRSQSREVLFQGPSIEMRDGSGQWRRASVVVGLPAGKLRQVLIDLRGHWLSEDRQIRISTDWAIYWDQAQIGEIMPEPVALQGLTIAKAQLRWRGYSTNYLIPDRTLELYHYLPAIGFWSWRYHRGDYTGYGDVKDLLERADDRLLVAAHGDELEIGFRWPSSGQKGDAKGFVFHAIGWGKDADPNTWTSTTVAPLPRKGVPYSSPALSARPADGEPPTPPTRSDRHVENSLLQARPKP